MFCSSCGAQVAEGAQFCTACGSPVKESRHTAHTWLRVGNLALDIIGAAVFAWVSIFLFLFLSIFLPIVGAFLFFPLIVLAYSGTLYYIFFESIWQRTPGKWATGTKVVKLDGTKPGFWRIVGRSFARLIPFEVFSFLFGQYPYGWHDRISKTMVVPTAYTVEEASKINPKDRGENSVALIIFGFLIVFLSCIALVGVLSGIVLASLNAAREEGRNVQLRTGLSSMRVDAEIYALSTEGYEGFCSYSRQFSLDSYSDTSFYYECNDSPEEWAASAGYEHIQWCADSSGQLVEVDGSLVGATRCPIN